MRHAPDRRRVLTLAAAVLAPAVFAPATSHAWRLPGPHLLRRAARRLGKERTIGVQLVGRVRSEAGPVPVTEAWRFEGRRASVEVVGPGGRRAAWTREQAPTGDPALAPSELTRLVLTRLFADRDPRLLARDLGVHLDEGHLAPVGDRVAHVLGASHARRRDRTLPTLWIDQTTFEVLRVVAPRQATRPGISAPPGAGGAVRLGGWTGPLTRGAFPRRLDVTAGGRWERRLEVSELRDG